MTRPGTTSCSSRLVVLLASAALLCGCGEGKPEDFTTAGTEDTGGSAGSGAASGSGGEAGSSAGAGSSSTGGSSSSSITLTCDAASPQACTACQGEKCCRELEACGGDADCACLAECVGEAGISGMSGCLDSCGVSAAPSEFDALEQCMTSSCPDADECG